MFAVINKNSHRLSVVHCIVACLAFCCEASFSQTAKFRHYSTDEGFTGSGIKLMTQDTLGFIWISSGSGLYKFDGYNFVNYKTNPPGDSLSFPMDDPFMLPYADPFGSVWIGFPDKLTYYERNLDGFLTFPIPTGGARPQCIWAEGPRVVWLATSGIGLVRFDRTTRSSSNFSNNHNNKTIHRDQNTIYDIVDEGPSLLLGTARGLWRFDKTSRLFGRPNCNSTDTGRLFNQQVRKIFKRADERWLWIGGQLVKLRTDFSIDQPLQIDSVFKQFGAGRPFEGTTLQIAMDREGKFWIASRGSGLIYYDPARGEMTTYRHNKNDITSLPSDLLSHVMVDRDNNVWAATVNKGIALVRKKNLHFINYLVGMSVTDVMLLPARKSLHLIAGTNGNGLWTATLDHGNFSNLTFKQIEPRQPIPGLATVIELYHDQDHVWVGTLNDGVVGFHRDPNTRLINEQPPILLAHDKANPNTLSGNFVVSLAADKYQRLWVGTHEQGLNVVNYKEYGKPGSVVRYRHDPSDSTTVMHDGVIDLRSEEDEPLLLGTFNGLAKVDVQDTSYPIEFQSVLKGVAVNRIYKTFSGSLLLCTKTGLYEGVEKDGKYSFSKAPLPGNPFAVYVQEDRLERLWLMSYQSMFFYDPANKTVVSFNKEDGLPSSSGVAAGGSAQTLEGIMIFSNSEGLTLFDPMTFLINDVRPRAILTSLQINNNEIKSYSQDRDEFVTPSNINTLTDLVLDYAQNILTLEFSAMDFTAPERNRYQHRLENFEEEWVESDWKHRSATYTNLEPGRYLFRVKASNRDGVWSDYEKTLAITVLPPPWKTWWAYSSYGLALAFVLLLARRNIIKQERLKAQLNLEHVQLEKAQEVDRIKSTFFTNISHEFRTPLTLIQGPVQLLQKEFAGNRKVLDRLNLVERNTSLLLKLINQLLDLARLESGKLEVERTEADLNMLLNSIIASFSSEALQKNIRIQSGLPAKEYVISIDKTKLETVLLNLIGNAIKFTPSGGRVLINANLIPSLGQNNQKAYTLLIRVADTGIGIPGEMQHKIFERFYQVNQSHKEIGTGIGLALVKELTNLLQGSIHLKSVPGKGSEFSLMLPVELLHSREGTASQANYPFYPDEIVLQDEPHTNDKSRIPKILVIEDHVDLRKFIIGAFENGYDFIEAGDGKEGLEKAIREIPELIISDVMMPEMDGITLTSKIKKDVRTSHIPIILLTAKATEQSKLHGLETGADDYVTKPFHKDELILKVKNIIDSRAKIREKIRLELLQETPHEEVHSADERFLRNIKESILRRLHDQQLSVELVASEVGLSRSQLYRKVTALTGLSMNELIRSFRLQKAAQLLTQHWGPVSQIAFEVGFSNLSYFTKCFKEQYGVPPSEYRK